MLNLLFSFTGILLSWVQQPSLPRHLVLNLPLINSRHLVQPRESIFQQICYFVVFFFCFTAKLAFLHIPYRMCVYIFLFYFLKDWTYPMRREMQVRHDLRSSKPSGFFHKHKELSDERPGLKNNLRLFDLSLAALWRNESPSLGRVHVLLFFNALSLGAPRVVTVRQEVACHLFCLACAAFPWKAEYKGRGFIRLRRGRKEQGRGKVERKVNLDLRWG